MQDVEIHMKSPLLTPLAMKKDILGTALLQRISLGNIPKMMLD